MTADRAMQNWRNLPQEINTLAASSRDFDKFECTKMRTSHSPKVIQGITTGNIDELQKCHLPGERKRTCTNAKRL